jgi:hypothetical protein
MDLDIAKMQKKLSEVLLTKSRNMIVKEIQETGTKFHQYHIDRFLAGDDVKLSTLQKIDKYLNG